MLNEYEDTTTGTVENPENTSSINFENTLVNDDEIYSGEGPGKFLSITFIVSLVLDTIQVITTFFSFVIFGAFFRFYLSSEVRKDHDTKTMYVCSIIGLATLGASIFFDLLSIYFSFYSKIIPALTKRKGSWIIPLMSNFMFLIFYLFTGIMMAIVSPLGLTLGLIVLFTQLPISFVYAVASMLYQRAQVVAEVKIKPTSRILNYILVFIHVTESTIFTQFLIYTFIKYIVQLVYAYSFPFVYVMIALYIVAFLYTIVSIPVFGWLLKWYIFTWPWTYVCGFCLLLEIIIYRFAMDTVTELEKSYCTFFINVDTFQLVMMFVCSFFWFVPQFLYMRKKKTFLFRLLSRDEEENK